MTHAVWNWVVPIPGNRVWAWRGGGNGVPGDRAEHKGRPRPGTRTIHGWCSWLAHLWPLPTEEPRDHGLGSVYSRSCSVRLQIHHCKIEKTNHFTPKCVWLRQPSNTPGSVSWLKFCIFFFFLLLSPPLQRPFKDGAAWILAQALPGWQDETLFPFSSEEVEVGHVTFSPDSQGAFHLHTWGTFYLCCWNLLNESAPTPHLPFI